MFSWKNKKNINIFRLYEKDVILSGAMNLLSSLLYIYFKVY